jgi:hypothetical protein
MESKRETQKLSIGKAKASIQRPRADTVIRKGLAEVLPTSVQKSYFMLTDAERGVLNTGDSRVSCFGILIQRLT